jgi:hypothetical protein
MDKLSLEQRSTETESLTNKQHAGVIELYAPLADEPQGEPRTILSRFNSLWKRGERVSFGQHTGAQDTVVDKYRQLVEAQKALAGEATALAHEFAKAMANPHHTSAYRKTVADAFAELLEQLQARARLLGEKRVEVQSAKDISPQEPMQAQSSWLLKAMWPGKTRKARNEGFEQHIASMSTTIQRLSDDINGVLDDPFTFAGPEERTRSMRVCEEAANGKLYLQNAWQPLEQRWEEAKRDKELVERGLQNNAMYRDSLEALKKRNEQNGQELKYQQRTYKYISDKINENEQLEAKNSPDRPGIQEIYSWLLRGEPQIDAWVERGEQQVEDGLAVWDNQIEQLVSRYEQNESIMDELEKDSAGIQEQLQRARDAQKPDRGEILLNEGVDELEQRLAERRDAYEKQLAIFKQVDKELLVWENQRGLLASLYEQQRKDAKYMQMSYKNILEHIDNIEKQPVGRSVRDEAEWREELNNLLQENSNMQEQLMENAQQLHMELAEQQKYTKKLKIEQEDIDQDIELLKKQLAKQEQKQKQLQEKSWQQNSQ